MMIDDKSCALQVTPEDLQLDEFREHVRWIAVSCDFGDFENACSDKVLHEQIPELNVTSLP